MKREVLWRRVILTAVSLLIPIVVILFLNLDPSIFATVGWYGYNGVSVAPEPIGIPLNHHGVSDRNSGMLAGVGDPVQFVNGVFMYTADGISLPGPGFGFSHFPSYNNNHEGGTASSSDGDAKLTQGWNWYTGILHLINMGSGQIRLVGPGYTASKFLQVGSSTTYAGKLGVDAKIIHDTTPKEMNLYATNGTVATFYDFDSSHGDKIGNLKKIVDAYGNDLTVDYYTSGENSNLVDLIQTITDTGGRTWNYSYIDSSGHVNNRRLSSVEVKTGSTTIAKVEFLHFGATGVSFASGSGSNGDLMRIRMKIKDSNGDELERSTLFRYYTGAWSSSNHGANHKIKYVFGPQSYSEFDAAVYDPLTETNDATIASHADYKLEYDSSSFVTLLDAKTASCGSCSGGGGIGSGIFTYTYSSNGSWSTSSADTVWRVSFTQTNPDTTYRIVDVNGAGTVINDVFQKDSAYASGEQRWISNCGYDGSWRVNQISNPSACSSYSESGHSVTVSTGAGLIERSTFDSNGNLTERKFKNGSSGSAYIIELRAYTSYTLGSHTIYRVTSIKNYRIATTSDTGADVTTLSHTPYSSSLGINETTITLPAVATGENGEGATHTHKYYFNTLGQLAWEMDEKGSITKRLFDSVLGLLTTAIVDMDTDGQSPPNGYENSNGLSLTTVYAFDNQGRSTTMTDPEGRVEAYHYTHLLNGEPVILIAPHLDTTSHYLVGPVRISIHNFDGDLITTALGVPTDGDDNLNDDLTESNSTLEAAFQGDLYERKEYEYAHGIKEAEILWLNAESGPGTIATEYGYDVQGRLVKSKDPEGTITRYHYTLDGRHSQKDIGTNDYGEELGEGTGPNNMTVVEKLWYDNDEDDAVDNDDVGDGNLTRVKKYIDSSASRDMDYSYDWRNRRTSADGEEKYFQKFDYDNQNRVIASYRYDTLDSSEGYLRSKAETKYDSRGRVFQNVVHEVNPSSGAIDDSITTNSWFDARGDLIKRAEPSGSFTKNVYDGARRLTKTFISYDTDTGTEGYPGTDVVDGDIVVEQVKYDRDKLGNVTLETRWERKYTDTTSTGEHTSTSTAERYYVASWYDEIHRIVVRADYGTNNGSSLTRPEDPGDISADALDSEFVFDSVGRLVDTVDPEGRTEKRSYDNLGRMTSLISYYVNGTPETSDSNIYDDRKQELDYDDKSRIIKRRVWMTTTSDKQETEYVYGAVKGTNPGDSKIASNDLLQKIKYPDPTSGDPSTSSADQESFAFNAQGDIIYRKDQVGTVHEFVYDELGKQTIDKATTLGTSAIDGTVRRIERSYDALDRILTTTSYDAVTSGNVKNQMELAYNGFGQVKESKQEHTGAIDAYTLSVVYSWTEAESDPISRLNYIQYPVTSRKAYFYYDDPAGSEYGKLDWILARPSGVSNSSTISADRIADYSYQGVGRAMLKENKDPASATIDQSFSYDRFGRYDTVVAWSGGTNINSFKYGYNRNSNIKWKEENYFSTKDEYYTLDQLDRLKEFDRGDLNGTYTGISGTPVISRDWTLDLVGNWDNIDSENRDHNRSNEITGTGDGTEVIDHDNNGNITRMKYYILGGYKDRYFWYDAWNRLVKVDDDSDPSADLLAKYYYDGLNRRIRDDIADRDYYYSEAWQLLSERDGDSVSSDKTKMEYVWGIRYVDEILERDEDKNSDGDTLDSADETLYYIQDHNWNVVTLCGESGSPVERVLYDPFGEPSFFNGSYSAISGTSYSNRVLFTGQLWTGSMSYTYDYRNREYNPYLGRFLQRDPIGNWGDEANFGNGYAYVGNKPIDLVDPSGLSIQPDLIADPREMVTKVMNIAIEVEASQSIPREYKVFWTLANISRQFWAGLNTDGKNQFVFTCRCGWLDMGHFWMAALGGFTTDFGMTMMGAWFVELSQQTPLSVINQLRKRVPWYTPPWNRWYQLRYIATKLIYSNP